MADFPEEIASARTFVFVREIEALLQMGLIKGGDLTNALVIYERLVPQERLDKLADTLGVEQPSGLFAGTSSEVEQRTSTSQTP